MPIGQRYSTVVPLNGSLLLRTATTDGDASFELVDSTASFTNFADEGQLLVNVTDQKSTYVRKVKSDSNLLVEDDIFDSGEDYKLLEQVRFNVRPWAGVVLAVDSFASDHFSDLLPTDLVKRNQWYEIIAAKMGEQTNIRALHGRDHVAIFRDPISIDSWWQDRNDVMAQGTDHSISEII